MKITNRDILEFIYGEGSPGTSIKGSKVKRKLRSAYYKKDPLHWILLKIKYGKYNWDATQDILLNGPLNCKDVLKDFAVWYKLIGEETFKHIVIDEETRLKILAYSDNIDEIYNLHRGYMFYYSVKDDGIYKAPFMARNPYAFANVKVTI